MTSTGGLSCCRGLHKTNFDRRRSKMFASGMMTFLLVREDYQAPAPIPSRHLFVPARTPRRCAPQCGNCARFAAPAGGESGGMTHALHEAVSTNSFGKDAGLVRV